MAQKQKKGQKYGRNLRSPSCKNQEFRTAKNKRLKQERHSLSVVDRGEKALLRAEDGKPGRGFARAKRREGMVRKAQVGA